MTSEVISPVVISESFQVAISDLVVFVVSGVKSVDSTFEAVLFDLVVGVPSGMKSV